MFLYLPSSLSKSNEKISVIEDNKRKKEKTDLGIIFSGG